MPKLENLKVKEIRDMISKYNHKVKIVGYSKMKKADLIKTLRNHPKLEITEGDTIKIKIKKDVEEPKKQVIKKGGRFITIKRKDKEKEPEPEPEPKPEPKKKVVIKKKPKPTKKNNNDEAGPAEESTEEIIKKSRQVVHKDFTLNDLEKQLKFQKSIGNTASVKALEKEIKELKGKAPAKKNIDDIIKESSFAEIGRGGTAKKEEPKATPAKKPDLKELEKLMIDLRKLQKKRSSEFDKVNEKFKGATYRNPVYKREFDAVPERIEKEQAKLFNIALKYPIGRSFGKPVYLLNKKGKIGNRADSILFNNVSKDLKSAKTDWFIPAEEQERRKKIRDEEAKRQGKIKQDEENRQKDYVKKIFKEFPKMEKEIVSVLKKKLTKGKENKELKQVREKYVKLQQKYRKETKAENIEDPIEPLSKRIIKAYKNKYSGGMKLFGLDYSYNPDKIQI